MSENTKIQNYLVRLPLKNVSNCRDLGGYPISDNTTVKWRVFLRSNNLVRMDEVDKQYLLDFGLKTVVDLRTPDEIIETPNPLSEEQTIDYYNVNLTGKEKQGESIQALVDDGIIPEDLLSENYIVMLNTKDKIKEVFDIFLNAGEGAILFHCNAGKDRTGVIAMLLLGLVGVAEQDIISNYETSLTNIYHDVSHKFDPYYKHILSSDPGNIIKSMNYIEDEYGNYENYFKWLGFTNEEIASLKEMLIEYV